MKFVSFRDLVSFSGVHSSCSTEPTLRNCSLQDFIVGIVLSSPGRTRVGVCAFSLAFLASSTSYHNSLMYVSIILISVVLHNLNSVDIYIIYYLNFWPSIISFFPSRFYFLYLKRAFRIIVILFRILYRSCPVQRNL